MIIGVTGFFAAGKDMFAEILKRKGFKHVSLSDIIRSEIIARGDQITIPLLTEVGNELRSEFGPQVLAERALAALSTDGDAVVTSIRHGAEVDSLRLRQDFSMIFIDAPLQLRFQRSLARSRPGDPMTVEEFSAAEAGQMESNDPNGQQLLICKEMADIVIVNEGSVEEFRSKVEKVLSDLSRKTR